MKVAVLNGSPKGRKSVTLQSVLFLKNIFSEDEFEIFNVAQKIKAFDDDEKLREIVEACSKADLILFSYPVYTFIVPEQLMCFVNYLTRKNITFDNAYVTQISTSAKFYDVTAHNYIKDVAGDFNSKYIDGISEEMEDLLNENFRNDLKKWWEYVRYNIQNGLGAVPYVNKDRVVTQYIPTMAYQDKSDNKGVVIITDNKDNSNLSGMIADFTASLEFPAEVVNLNDFDFKCGCLGCLKCTSTGHCAVEDDFEVFYNTRVAVADAVVYAFTIENHSISPTMKLFFDRQFFNGHRLLTINKPTASIISGNYHKEPNLMLYTQARNSVAVNFDCGVVTDEMTADTLGDIIAVANKMNYALVHNLKAQKNFFNIGGMKIFRDMVWIMRGLMKADHKFYKEQGYYDFPQKKIKKFIRMKFVGTLSRSIYMKDIFGENFLMDGMLIPYRKFTERDEKLNKRKKKLH